MEAYPRSGLLICTFPGPPDVQAPEAVNPALGGSLSPTTAQRYRLM